MGDGVFVYKNQVGL